MVFTGISFSPANLSDAAYGLTFYSAFNTEITTMNALLASPRLASPRLAFVMTCVLLTGP